MDQQTECSSSQSCSTCSTGSTCDSNTQQAHTDAHITETLNKIDRRLVIMSGKGGVGKSTVSVNLAVALAMNGKKVGILDADVHGPNVPKMLGLDKTALTMGPNGLIPAVSTSGVKVMSMGFLIDNADTPVAWRGPMKHSLFQQFIADVDWGTLDYLIIDLPPGTGDEPLSIVQLLGKPLWTIIVTTPQEVALLDSRKSVVFGQHLETNVLGIVENMSGLVCPHCSQVIDLFKTGGGKKSAEELGVPFLGAIPIDPNVVIGGDSGIPVTADNPDSQIGQAFKELAMMVDTAVHS
jgi:ATP-binding protein involved in chromosome partitioning